MPAPPIPAARTPAAPRFDDPIASADGASPRCAVAAARCYHCASPNPAGGRWRAFVNGAEREFCCGGCLAVAKRSMPPVSNRSTRRTAAADRAGPSAHPRGRTSGRTGTSRGAVRAGGGAAGRAEVSLLLEGIHCGACIWLIESGCCGSRAWPRRASFATRGRTSVGSGTGAAFRSAGAVARVGTARTVRPGAARGVCAARIARLAARMASRCCR